uniref:Uncharacterized protein n=2 Tax=Meloidogyne TaxID=189290 RepID=A0A6V7U2J7_MELEN|nr:unnamed protein product [Meloidogyne enterolobii]
MKQYILCLIPEIGGLTDAEVGLKLMEKKVDIGTSKGRDWDFDITDVGLPTFGMLIYFLFHWKGLAKEAAKKIGNNGITIYVDRNDCFH